MSGREPRKTSGPSSHDGGPIHDSENLHASCVAWHDRAVLITGPSGAGKSSLALQLMALGCTLVADDRTIVTRAGDHVTASCPPAIRGTIEARFVGILNAKAAPDPVALCLIVDLSQQETDRLPPSRVRSLFGLEIALVYESDTTAFPSAILQYLKGGRSA